MFNHSFRSASLAAGLGILVATCSLPVLAQSTNARGTASAQYLNAGDLERQAGAEGIVNVREIELKGRLAKVKGRDDAQRSVSLTIDRATGEVLTRKVKERRYHD